MRIDEGKKGTADKNSIRTKFCTHKTETDDGWVGQCSEQSSTSWIYAYMMVCVCGCLANSLHTIMWTKNEIAKNIFFCSCFVLFFGSFGNYACERRRYLPIGRGRRKRKKGVLQFYVI